MARKLFIQTHGCQMNEYDSTRMVDLLESSHGLKPPTTRKKRMYCFSTPALSGKKPRKRSSINWAAGKS